MKKTFYSIVVLLTAYALNAQITITSSNMPSSGNTILYSNAKLSSIGNYTATGTNHTWNFDTLSPSSQTLREFKSGINTPYSILFGFTAYGEKTIDTVPIPAIPVPGIPSINITDVYSFYKKTNSAFTAEGLGIKINGIPVPNYYTDEDELYKFPLTYGNTKDSTTFRFSTIASTLIPFTYIKQGYRITEVDGWGTITTPYGTANCIRLITTQYSIDTLKGTVTLPVIGTTPFSIGFPNYVRSYQWLTLGEKIPYLEVTGALNGNNFNLAQVKYRDITRQIVSVKEENNPSIFSIFPNPTSWSITVVTKHANTPSIVEITDLQGKLITHYKLQKDSWIENNHTIDVSHLAKGLYILNLSSNEFKQSVKISIQ